VRLTSEAPTGGARILLESSNTEVARVPATLTIAAGQTSGTFTVETTTVPTRTTAQISAEYAGLKRTANLTVTLPIPRASFTVTSPSRGSNACKLITDTDLDCVVNPSASEGIIRVWLWTLSAKNDVTERRETDNGEWTVDINAGCNWIEGMSSTTDSQGRYVEATFRLQVEDRDGTRSSTFSRSGIRIYVDGRCGFSD
jgi:hypothetical protein